MKKVAAERIRKPPNPDLPDSRDESAEERIKVLAADNDRLKKENTELFEIADQYDADKNELRIQVDRLEARLAEANVKADMLEHRLNSRSAVEDQQGCALGKIPETLVDVLKLAENTWPDRIVLTDASWKGAEEWNDNEGNVQDEYAILKAVSTVLCDMTIGKMPYEGNLSQVFQDVTGFEIALREGSVTKKSGKFMGKRACVLDGKECRMQMHVKGQNPKAGSRLYCEPDEERGVIVIGHCGHHLETAGTARRSVR